MCSTPGTRLRTTKHLHYSLCQLERKRNTTHDLSCIAIPLNALTPSSPTFWAWKKCTIQTLYNISFGAQLPCQQLVLMTSSLTVLAQKLLPKSIRRWYFQWPQRMRTPRTRSPSGPANPLFTVRVSWIPLPGSLWNYPQSGNFMQEEIKSKGVAESAIQKDFLQTVWRFHPTLLRDTKQNQWTKYRQGCLSGKIHSSPRDTDVQQLWLQTPTSCQ